MKIRKYICFARLEGRGWAVYGTALEVRSEKVNLKETFSNISEKIKKEGHVAYPVTHVVYYPIQDILP